jgi:uncharacterized protein with PQ loop repeat
LVIATQTHPLLHLTSTNVPIPSPRNDHLARPKLATTVRLALPLKPQTNTPSILLILSFLSFLPQLHLLWSKRDSSGISPYYILFNLLSATSQLTISFYGVVNAIEPSDVFVHNPVDAGDWLNLIHFAVVWGLWVIMFVLYSGQDN